MNKNKIAQSFAQASPTYEDNAPVQDLAAAMTADLCQSKLSNPPSIGLEIGCGTGLLTGRLFDLYPGCDWRITDLSQEMVQSCSQKHPDQGRFEVQDGENLTFQANRFDVIVSSLAYQWFFDLSRALENQMRVLKPGGRLIFATLGQDTFREWRTFLDGQGLAVGLHDYPNAEKLLKMCPDGVQMEITSHRHRQPYPSALSFLRALKRIGAQTPKAGYQPLTIRKMRSALKQFDPANTGMTYEILLCCLEKRQTP